MGYGAFVLIWPTAFDYVSLGISIMGIISFSKLAHSLYQNFKFNNKLNSKQWVYSEVIASKSPSEIQALLLSSETACNRLY